MSKCVHCNRHHAHPEAKDLCRQLHNERKSLLVVLLCNRCDESILGCSCYPVETPHPNYRPRFVNE